MKKTFITLLCLLFIVGCFAGCKKSNSNQNKNTDIIVDSIETTTSSIQEINQLNKKMLTFQIEFADVKNKLSEKYPVILSSNISNYMDDAEKECKKLKKKNKIKSYERTGDSIYIQVDDDFSYVFEVPVEDQT